MDRPGRLAVALAIRTAALALIRMRGSMQAIEGVSGRVQTCEFGSLSILHRTPFQRLHVSTPQTLLKAALFKQATGREAPRTLEYGLDIWDERRKVFNLEWALDDKEIELVNFKRGTWEDALSSAELTAGSPHEDNELIERSG